MHFLRDIFALNYINNDKRLDNNPMRRRRQELFTNQVRPLVAQARTRLMSKPVIPLATISMPPLCNRSPEKFPSTPSALAYRWRN